MMDMSLGTQIVYVGIYLMLKYGDDCALLR
jgi:hypothetical protein